MPRLHIELPDAFRFSTDIPLYVTHMNAARHLDNAQLLGIVSEARARFLASLGYSLRDIEGVSFVVADNAVQYRSEAVYGEVMVVEMTANDFTSRGCDLPWRMTDRASGREVARGKTGVVFFDFARRQVAHVPPAFRARWP